jgi:hypothetical protein
MIKPTNRSRSLFLAIEAILYILLLFVSLPLRGGTVHYLSILVVALLAWLVKDSSPRLNFVRIAMLFTVFADLFLTYLRVEQLLGTGLFALAQLAFAGRLIIDETDKRFWIVLRFAFVAIVFVIGVVVVGEAADFLFFTALFYYANLLANAFHALIRFRKTKLFAIGLLFYIGCDTLVGLSQSAGYITIEPTSIWYWLLHFPIDLVWFFYLPSQVLLVVSSIAWIKPFKPKKTSIAG